jgi:hypothetical protein
MRARHVVSSDSLIPIRLDQRLEPSVLENLDGRDLRVPVRLSELIRSFGSRSDGRDLDKGERAHRGDIGFQPPTRSAAREWTPASFWPLLDNGVTTTGCRETRRARVFDRHCRLFPLVARSGGWRCAGGHVLRARSSTPFHYETRQARGVRGCTGRKEERWEGEGGARFTSGVGIDRKHPQARRTPTTDSISSRRN